LKSIKVIFYAIIPLVVIGCAGNSPPEIPAIEVAPDVPYLWPEEQSGLQSSNENEEYGNDSTLGIENGIIAVVGDRIVTLNEFDFNFYQALQQYGDSVNGRDLYIKVLNMIIERFLLLELAEQKEIEVEELEIDEAFEKHLQKLNISFEAYRSLLAEQKKSIADTRDQIKENIILQKLDSVIYRGLFSPSPKNVLAEYQKNKEAFTSKEMRDISLIVVFVGTYGSAGKAENEINKISKRLESESFSAVAKQMSGGAKADKGGRQGFIGFDDLAEPIAKVAFSLKEGRISSVNKMPGAFFIIKNHKIKKAETISFKEVQHKIKQNLMMEMRINRRQKAIAQIKKLTYIRKLSPTSYQKYSQGARK